MAKLTELDQSLKNRPLSPVPESAEKAKSSSPDGDRRDTEDGIVIAESHRHPNGPPQASEPCAFPSQSSNANASSYRGLEDTPNPHAPAVSDAPHDDTRDDSAPDTAAATTQNRVSGGALQHQSLVSLSDSEMLEATLGQSASPYNEKPTPNAESTIASNTIPVVCRALTGQVEIEPGSGSLDGEGLLDRDRMSPRDKDVELSVALTLPDMHIGAGLDNGGDKEDDEDTHSDEAEDHVQDAQVVDGHTTSNKRTRSQISSGSENSSEWWREMPSP